MSQRLLTPTLRGSLISRTSLGLNRPARSTLLHLRSVSSSSTDLASNNAQEIEKLNELVKKKLVELQEMEKKRIIDESKPKISDFQRPILITFVIASTVYLAYHWLWWSLEFEEREKELQRQLEEKEKELESTLSQLGQPQPKRRRWWWFW